MSGTSVRYLQTLYEQNGFASMNQKALELQSLLQNYTMRTIKSGTKSSSLLFGSLHWNFPANGQTEKPANRIQRPLL